MEACARAGSQAQGWGGPLLSTSHDSCPSPPAGQSPWFLERTLPPRPGALSRVKAALCGERTLKVSLPQAKFSLGLQGLLGNIVPPPLWSPLLGPYCPEAPPAGGPRPHQPVPSWVGAAWPQ